MDPLRAALCVRRALAPAYPAKRFVQMASSLSAAIAAIWHLKQSRAQIPAKERIGRLDRNF
jgi:hypothetical protein